MRSKYTCSIFVATALFATAVVAQPQPQPQPPVTPVPLPDGDKLFVLENLPPLATMGARIDFIRSEGGVPGPVVKDKPYSARAITESTQTLADGNRITQRNEAVLYRDAAGRTRREQTLTGFGQWQVGEPVTMINIYDPAAGKGYVLDPTARTAREMRPFQVALAQAPEQLEAGGAGLATWNIAVPAPPPGAPSPPGAVSGSVSVGVDRDVTIVRREGGREDVQVFSAAAAAPVAVFPPGTTGMYEPAEDLGEQVLEGLLVKGTRMTDTIPAGTIGNERPIEVVTERWYSEQLDAMVLQRFSDPRVGETTYRLVNVVLGEPSPDLFQVPQGFEIKTPELPQAGVRVAPGGGTVQFRLQRPEAAPAQ